MRQPKMIDRWAAFESVVDDLWRLFPEEGPTAIMLTMLIAATTERGYPTGFIVDESLADLEDNMWSRIEAKLG